MKKKKYLYYTLGLSAFVLICSLAIYFSRSKKDRSNEEIGDTINIGVVSRFAADKDYGPISAYGAYIGAMSYLKKINASGGIYNRKINFIIKDTAPTDSSLTVVDPRLTIKNFNEIMQNNNIFSFMWSVCTVQTEVMSNLLKGTGIPLLFPLTSKFGSESQFGSERKKGIYYIRPSYIDEYKNGITNFLHNRDANEHTTMATEREAICYASREVFLKNTDSVKKVNLGFYYNSNFHPPVKDINLPEYKELKHNVELLKKNGVKTVVLLSTTTGAYILKIAEKLNYHPNYVTASTLNSDYIVTYFYPHMSNFYSVSPFPIPAVSKNLKVVNEFDQDLNDSGYKGYRSAVMLEGYVGAKLLVDTLRKVGPNLTRKKFIDTLESTKNLDYGGVSFTFSPTVNSGNHKVYFYKYTNGIPELVKY